MEKFTHIAYIAWRLTSSSKAVVILIKLLPMLAHIVLTKKQLLEFGNLLQEVSFFAEQEHDVGSMTFEIIFNVKNVQLIHSILTSTMNITSTETAQLHIYIPSG